MEDDSFEFIECLKAKDKEDFAFVINGFRISIEEFDNTTKG